jgi:phosphoenolpyruvate carboxykinase (GTP)
MAMLPFCGYHMGDYFQHWIEMGEKLGDKAPKIFNVNWFRTDADGHFIWPGFGDNFRVVEWIMKRACDEADAVDTAIGYQPKAEDINLDGLEDFSIDTLKEILAVDKAAWAKEAEGIEEFYKNFGDKLPAALKEQLAALKEACK